MQYTANDIKEFLGSYEQHFTHVVVAHTNFRPYIDPVKGKHINNHKRIAYQIEQTKRDLRYSLNVFSKLLYPKATNKARRNPSKYRPLTFVTIEGARETADRAQTIHVNITLGNLPNILTADDVHTLFTEAWHHKAKQSKNIKVIDYIKGTDNQWTGYTLKEAQQANYRAVDAGGIWDVENCWIPTAALAAD
jgi:hypothetical protein